MAWSDGISIIYIVNLLLLTNECQLRSSADYALGVEHKHLTHTWVGKHHVEPAIGWLCVLQSLDSKMSVIVAALTLA